MEDKKLAAIQAAYGDAWEKVKEHVGEDGWCNRSVKGNSTNGMEPEGHGFDLNSIDLLIPSGAGFYRSVFYPLHMFFKWRPKSLSGIENNNGWTRCDERMPDKSDAKYYIFENGKLAGTTNGFSINNVRNAYLREPDKHVNITHWRPIDPVKPPIY